MSLQRGYCAIGIVNGKTEANLGTLHRSAYVYGAAFVFTVGRRYTHQASDTPKSWRHMPVFHYADLDDLIAHLPYSCPLVGVEMTDEAHPIGAFAHPERAVYLLGAEDNGLTLDALRRCHSILRLPGDRSVNVAVAGSIVLFDRRQKAEQRREATP